MGTNMGNELIIFEQGAQMITADASQYREFFIGHLIVIACCLPISVLAMVFLP